MVLQFGASPSSPRLFGASPLSGNVTVDSDSDWSAPLLTFAHLSLRAKPQSLPIPDLMGGSVDRSSRLQLSEDEIRGRWPVVRGATFPVIAPKLTAVARSKTALW